MAETGQMHWHEGLFLQPHHLQYAQRLIHEQFASERRLSGAYPYGLIEARLSSDALENMMVRFDRLRAVMPSGLEINMPANADLPALDIKRAFSAGSGTLNVRLGVPLYYADRGNAIEKASDDDWRVKRLFRVAETQRSDENTGENPQPMLVRRINARLLLEDDDDSDLETLPLLRIAHATGQDVGLPRQDPAFIPPCLLLNGSAALRELVRDLANQVEASRSELVVQLTRGGFSLDTVRGQQLEQMFRLRTLNRFAGRLPALVAAPAIAPFVMYLELRDLLGELAALQPDRDLFEIPRYDHDNPGLAFQELSSRIRSLLRGVVAASFLQVEFAPDNRVLTAKLSDDHLGRPNEYFLGIKTKDDPRGLAVLIEDIDKFKLMASSLINQRIFGIRLAEERHPPLELPSAVGLHYFRLLRSESGRMWERIGQEKSVSLRWPGMESSDFSCALYMTVPGAEGKP